jgi:DNA-binding GntR family transcriptional regulator
MTNTATIAPRALYQEVAERLRQQIFAGELEPGSWIDELKQCAELGISRTPLREALKVLAAEGLVTMKVRRGAYVTEMSARDVQEAYQLLALLESDAAAKVAETASAEQLLELQSLHAELEQQLAPADRQRPAPHDEAEPAFIAVQAGPDRRIAGRTPGTAGRIDKP